MSSTNQSPAYLKAQGKFLNAKTDEDRIEALEEMIKECPKHKGAEGMLANLKTRYKKLKEKIETGKKAGKSSSSKQSIKKEEMQGVIVGINTVGKSSLLSSITNVKMYDTFAKNYPFVGIMDYYGTPIQIVENPSIESEYYDKGLTNNADVVIILIDNLEQIKKIEETIQKAVGKRLIIFNKIDLLEEHEKRKITATLSTKYSKKYDFVLISCFTKEGYIEFKDKLFKNFNKIRIYTKEPGKLIEEKTEKPVILNPNSTVKNVAEKILKGFSSRVKETKIWGPSSKFPGQIVGMNHKLKDKDVVEFKIR